MADRVGRWAEIVVATLTVAAAAAMLYDGRNLAANPFEPIGSRTIPSIAAAIVIGLAVLVLADAAWSLRRGPGAAPSGEQWLVVIAVFLLTVGYALVLASGWVRYQWATIVFMPLVVLMVSDDRRKALPWALGMGLVYGFGLDAIFRHVLVTDIP